MTYHATMSKASKPHLKLYLDGKVSLVKIGINAWSEEQAKKQIQRRYGSLARFARRFGFDYLHVVNAFHRQGGAIECAGGIADVRQLLGLKSHPSAASIAQVEAQQRRWTKRFATHQSARASERLDRQSAGAGCVSDTQTGARA